MKTKLSISLLLVLSLFQIGCGIGSCADYHLDGTDAKSGVKVDVSLYNVPPSASVDECHGSTPYKVDFINNDGDTLTYRLSKSEDQQTITLRKIFSLFSTFDSVTFTSSMHRQILVTDGSVTLQIVDGESELTTVIAKKSVAVTFRQVVLN